MQVVFEALRQAQEKRAVCQIHDDGARRVIRADTGEKGSGIAAEGSNYEFLDRADFPLLYKESSAKLRASKRLGGDRSAM